MPARAEYEDPTNRRFHAQPVACPDCGPFVQLRAPSELFSKVVNIDMRWSAIVKARRLLREGKIIAIKGLGGFHLACDTSNESAVAELRRRKGRAGKPFALMFADVKTVGKYCFVDRAEMTVLNGHEKPIVLLDRKARTDVGPL